MENFYKVLLSCCILLGVFITSCSDDNIKEDPYPDLEEDMVDLTDGLDVKIVDLGKDNDIRIPLGTKKEILWEIFSSYEDNHKFNFKVETDNENLKYLVCERPENLLNEKEAPRVYNLKVSLTNGEQEKTVKLVVRNSGENSFPAYARNHIGHGMNPTDQYQATRGKILNEEALSNVMINNSITDESKKFDAFEMGGIRFPELMMLFSEYVGVPGDVISKGIFTAGEYFGYPSQHDSVANYEDYIGILRALRENVFINDETLSADRAAEELFKYLDTDINDILNNRRTSGYLKYGNDEEGITRLLDDLGAYVITGGTFGSSFSYLYSRKENAYLHHIGVDARANIHKTEADKIGNTGYDFADWSHAYTEYMEKYAGHRSYLDGNSSFRSYYTVDSRPEKYYSKVRRSGVIPGNNDKYFLNKTKEFTDTVYDICDWIETYQNPKEDLKQGYTLVGYSPIFSENGVETEAQKNNFLIPIYEFINEPVRRAAVEKYFNSYLASNVPQFQKHHLVIKEFYMKYAESTYDNDTSHRVVPEQEGFYKSYLDDNIVFRRVLMANSNARYDAGFPLETNQDDYIVATSDKRHYWYYVLGYHEDGDGIVDLRLKNKDPGSPWIGLGDNADNGTGWADNKDNLIYVTRASKDEPYENKIKAVALAFDKGMNEYYGDKIIGSTPPVAMDYPFPTTSSALHATNYWNYWSTNYPAMYDGTHFYEGVVVYYPFHIIYNKQPLPDFGENGLCFGLNSTGLMEETPSVPYPKSFREQH